MASSEDRFAKYYASATDDAGVFAKRYCELYEKTRLCSHARPAKEPLGACDDECFRPS